MEKVVFLSARGFFMQENRIPFHDIPRNDETPKGVPPVDSWAGQPFPEICMEINRVFDTEMNSVIEKRLV